MEFLLAALFILGVLVFVFRTSKIKHMDAPSQSSTQWKPYRKGRPSSVSKPPKTAEKQSVRFDEHSSKHLSKPRTLEGPVYVTDGDTIRINKTQVRLFGVDAPEINHPYGKKAKWALHTLCKGQTVRAEVTDEDEYGRTVAHCFLPDGRDLSAEMVKQGLAIDWPKFSGGKYKQLETLDARKKLWLADARQKGRMHVWKKFEARQTS